MIGLLLAASLWIVDRIEGPFAVLRSVEGDWATQDVPRAAFRGPLSEGDRVSWPGGRVVHTSGRAARAARLTERFERLAALASSEEVGQVPTVKKRPDHRQDHYFHKAKREGFAARSVYKLEEIDKKGQLFRKGQHILDLGCAPGSWMQYLAGVVGPTGHVAGVDLKPVNVHLPSHATSIVGDAFGLTDEQVTGLGGPFDVVTSDMAPATIGDRFTDHMRSIELCRRALEVAVRSLRPGGGFVCKVFEGEDAQAFYEEVRGVFREVRRVKPKSTRTESVELFVVGTGYLPPALP